MVQGALSAKELLEPALPPRHLSHLRISPLWQMFIKYSDANNGQQSHPPQTPPTPAKRESHAKHASKASRSASTSTSSVPRPSGSERSPGFRLGSPPGSSGPAAGQLESAGPVLDWLYGLTTLHHELPRLPGESYLHLGYSLFFKYINKTNQKHVPKPTGLACTPALLPAPLAPPCFVCKLGWCRRAFLSPFLIILCRFSSTM